MSQVKPNQANDRHCRCEGCIRSSIEAQLDFDLRCWLTGKPNGRAWNLSRTKRLIDATIATLIVAFFAPLMMFIAIAIKLTSKGPVFFAQDRTGYMGRRFKMYKFRTMVQNAEELKAAMGHLNHHAQQSPDFKVKNDPRITPVGLFLRKYSLDELPQFYNVIKGDMRLVGPRPTSFGVERYEQHHLSRLASPPGLTGIWQISGRSNIDFDGRVELDRDYIRKQSPVQDIKILIKTPMAVLKGDGAY